MNSAAPLQPQQKCNLILQKASPASFNNPPTRRLWLKAFPSFLMKNEVDTASSPHFCSRTLSPRCKREKKKVESEKETKANVQSEAATPPMEPRGSPSFRVQSRIWSLRSGRRPSPRPHAALQRHTGRTRDHRQPSPEDEFRQQSGQ